MTYTYQYCPNCGAPATSDNCSLNIPTCPMGATLKLTALERDALLEHLRMSKSSGQWFFQHEKELNDIMEKLNK